MNIALRTRRMTREEFLDWAQAQEARYEFDGFEAVAMVGGTNNHSRVCHNLWSALRTRLRGSGCETLGPDAGLATIGDAVRYPDALVSWGKVPGEARLVPDVRVVFEVLSPTSGRNDRIVKLREYAAVSSIRRYVILEYTVAALTSFERDADDAPWKATALTADETLRLPEIGIEIPVGELYEGVDLPAADGATD